MNDQLEASIRSALDDIVAGERGGGTEPPFGGRPPLSTIRSSDGGPTKPSAAGRLVLAAACMVLVAAGLVAVAMQNDSTPSMDSTGAVASDAATVAALIQESRDQVGTSMGNRCEDTDGRQVEQWFRGDVEPPPYIPVVRLDDAGECTVGGWVSRMQQFPQYEEYEHSETGALGEQPVHSLQYIYDEAGTVIGELLVEGPLYYENP